MIAFTNLISTCTSNRDRNNGPRFCLGADKMYDKNAFREWLRDHCIRPLIRHCLYAEYDNARTPGCTMNSTTGGG